MVIDYSDDILEQSSKQPKTEKTALDIVQLSD